MHPVKTTECRDSERRKCMTNLIAIDGKVSRAVECDEKVGERDNEILMLAPSLLKIAFYYKLEINIL